VRKRNLARDSEVQTLEDALCLVFFETQLHELVGRLDEGKQLEIVRKILVKMSAEGICQLEELPLGRASRALIKHALGAGVPPAADAIDRERRWPSDRSEGA